MAYVWYSGKERERNLDEGFWKRKYRILGCLVDKKLGRKETANPRARRFLIPPILKRKVGGKTYQSKWHKKNISMTLIITQPLIYLRV